MYLDKILFFGIFISASASAQDSPWTALENAVNCSTPGQVDYCSTCFEITYCIEDNPPVTSPCDVLTTSCAYVNTRSYADCIDPPVPECRCDTYPSLNADPYNSTYYFICLDPSGPPISAQCENGAHFDAALGDCEKAPTTPSVPSTSALPPSKPCTSNDFYYDKISCTEYQVCYLNTAYVYRCDEGEVFNDQTDSCELYSPFTCADKVTDGPYPDTTDCYIYHFCIDGQEVNTFVCRPDIFDPDSNSCIPDTGTCTVNTCTLTIDSAYCSDPDCVGIYPIAGNDNSYYTCVDDGTCKAIARECPSGMIFNPDTTYCEVEPSKWNDDLTNEHDKE